MHIYNIIPISTKISVLTSSSFGQVNVKKTLSYELLIETSPLIGIITMKWHCYTTRDSCWLILTSDILIAVAGWCRKRKMILSGYMSGVEFPQSPLFLSTIKQSKCFTVTTIFIIHRKTCTHLQH